jgi:hypothetical protein
MKGLNVNDELERMGKEAVVLSIYLEWPMKTKKNLSQDNRYRGRDLNRLPPEYESGVITTRT